jgi:Tol biopolymer transport system component
MLVGCAGGVETQEVEPIVPHEDRWGIYQLDLDTEQVELLLSSKFEISTVRLNNESDTLVFSQKLEGSTNEHYEVIILGLDDRHSLQLTENDLWDLYPAWSPDGSQIAYLSWRESTLDIYVMGVDGSNQRLLYDSGFHDADIDWVGDQIAFTSQGQIWIMQEDGSNVRQLTNHHRAGEWGNANLPFGDFDPRISPDGSRVLFSRMVDDRSQHGNYDLYVVDIDDENLIQLTDTGYSQGLSNWSKTGDRILYIIAEVDDVGQHDVYVRIPMEREIITSLLIAFHRASWCTG